MKNRWLSHLFYVLILAEALLVFLSWLINAAVPDVPMRSLLSNEGIRWFFGHFVENMNTPLLIWFLLLSMAWGAVHKSKITRIFPLARLGYRQRLALRLSAVVAVSIIVVIILLTCIPKAILLSSSGNLFPSSFSVAIIPILAFSVIVCSLLYGLVSGSIADFHHAFLALASGIVSWAPVFPLYVVGAELYSSLCFVLWFH